jgi:hypothetical protein
MPAPKDNSVRRTHRVNGTQETTSRSVTISESQATNDAPGDTPREETRDFARGSLMRSPRVLAMLTFH